MYYNTINDLNNDHGAVKMIYQRIDFNGFKNAFERYGRSAQFSDMGLQLLFNYIADLSNDTGQDIALDVIALCCQYSELDRVGYLVAYKEEDGVETIEELEQALIDGDLERVIRYDIDNNIILVNDEY